MGLGAHGGRLDQRTVLHEPRLERQHDRARQLVLDRKDALELAIVALRPQVIPVRHADQLREDPELIALSAHAPFQDGGDVQLRADLPDVEVLALEEECGGAGDDANALDVGERVDDLLGHAVGEVLVLLVAAQVREGQHHDRRRCRRGLAPAAEAEVPDQAGSRGQHADAGEQQQAPHARAPALGPFQAATLDVEDPRQGDDDGETCRERNHDVGEHSVGPMQTVHDGLDDLEHGEGGDAVSQQRAKDAPALQFDQQGQRHGLSPS